MSSGYVEGEDFEQIQSVDEDGVNSSAAGAFLPSLHASPKQYKGPELKESQDKEKKLAAGKAKVYMKKKWGWKDAPSIPNRPSKGGFIYKKIFEDEIEEREEKEKFGFKIGDKVQIDKSVNNSWKEDGFGEIVSFDGEEVVVNVTSGGGSTFIRQMVVPKDKLSLQSSEIKKQEKKEKKKEKEKEKKEMEKETIKEGLKTEIKVRNKKQQFQEATKMVNKKLKEINSILEYAKNIKTDLNEVECESCSRMMESIKLNIAEAYKKMKNL
jgi:hypothetical protein